MPLSLLSIREKLNLRPPTPCPVLFPALVASPCGPDYSGFSCIPTPLRAVLSEGPLIRLLRNGLRMGCWLTLPQREGGHVSNRAWDYRRLSRFLRMECLDRPGREWCTSRGTEETPLDVSSLMGTACRSLDGRNSHYIGPALRDHACPLHLPTAPQKLLLWMPMVCWVSQPRDLFLLLTHL